MSTRRQNMTPQRALRIAHFTRALLSFEPYSATDMPFCGSVALWLAMAQEAEDWATAKLDGRPTNVWVFCGDRDAQHNGQYILTDCYARLLARTWCKEFGFMA